MTTIDGNNLYIPSEILREIFSYAPEHRENMVNVLDELLYVTNYTTCDNENCEAELYKHEDHCVTSWVVDNEHHFCNEECASYGEWSIRYDIRKSRRNERRRLTFSN